jgi:hypothetical protein
MRLVQLYVASTLALPLRNARVDHDSLHRRNAVTAGLGGALAGAWWGPVGSALGASAAVGSHFIGNAFKGNSSNGTSLTARDANSTATQLPNDNSISTPLTNVPVTAQKVAEAPVSSQGSNETSTLQHLESNLSSAKTTPQIINSTDSQLDENAVEEVSASDPGLLDQQVAGAPFDPQTGFPSIATKGQIQNPKLSNGQQFADNAMTPVDETAESALAQNSSVAQVHRFANQPEEQMVPAFGSSETAGSGMPISTLQPQVHRFASQDQMAPVPLSNGAAIQASMQPQEGTFSGKMNQQWGNPITNVDISTTGMSSQSQGMAGTAAQMATSSATEGVEEGVASEIPPEMHTTQGTSISMPPVSVPSVHGQIKDTNIAPKLAQSTAANTALTLTGPSAGISSILAAGPSNPLEADVANFLQNNVEQKPTGANSSTAANKVPVQAPSSSATQQAPMKPPVTNSTAASKISASSAAINQALKVVVQAPVQPLKVAATSTLTQPKQMQASINATPPAPSVVQNTTVAATAKGIPPHSRPSELTVQTLGPGDSVKAFQNEVGAPPRQ